MRRLLPYLAVVTVFWLVPATCIAVVAASLPTTTDGQCLGYGPGCPAPPVGVVAVWCFLAAPYLFLGGCLGLGVVAVVQSRRAAREPVPWVEPDRPD